MQHGKRLLSGDVISVFAINVALNKVYLLEYLKLSMKIIIFFARNLHKIFYC